MNVSGLTWLGITIIALVVAAVLVEAYLKRNRKRRLVEMRPDADKISRVSGIERYGLDPVELAQAEHRRLEEEGWGPAPHATATDAAETRKKDKQDERR